jgi:hypothetical protein
MKQLLPTTIAAVLLVGCGKSAQQSSEVEPAEPVAEVPAQQSSPPAEAEPVESVAEVAKQEPTTAKAPDISFWKAAMNGNIKAVKQQLAAGADVNAKDGIGWTPLHSAAGRGRKEVNELLIANGADVNAKDNWGMTPLHRAAEMGRKEIAELLIAAGTYVNAKDKRGRTPLDLNFLSSETADLLRKHGGKTKKELEAAGE